MAKELVAMLLAGGQGSRLYALTQKLAKPAVPFGGKYRIIDFPLSNCATKSPGDIFSEYTSTDVNGMRTMTESIVTTIPSERW